MASAPITPMPPAAGGAPSGGPQPGAGGVGASGGGAAGKLARLSMDAQAIASETPETAPMMREIQNQVRMATMKMIQQRQSTQQATPQI